MSDDIATAPASTPASPSSEVAIETNPVSQPTPVGSQAPDKPVGDFKGSEHRPQSRREAIQAAYERALHPPRDKPKTAPKATAEPAEAKAGHNQPPEETEKFDLKKRPGEQLRGERGRFASSQNEQLGTVRRGHFDAQAGVQTAQTDTQTAQTPQNQDNRTPYSVPLPRMSDRAKADWARTPESVRGDLHRMNKEVSQAFQYYKQDYETMKTLRPFAEMAKQHGTSLDKALTNYVNMEHKLRADPVAGLDTIVHNLNLVDPETNQRITLRDVAYYVLNQTPEQLRAVQQGNAQTAATHQIGALHQEVSGLKNTLQQMVHQQHFTYNRSLIDQFAITHPRFDEISDLIKKEIDLGFDLETAYRRAELLRPAPHAAQTRTTSAQTRTTDRSISGAPAGPVSNGTGRRSEKPVGRREAIQHAIKRVNGSL